MNRKEVGEMQDQSDRIVLVNKKQQQSQHYTTSPQLNLNIQSSSSFISAQQQQSSPEHPPLRMIEFIDSLYSKYKILNLLSEQQSNNFQTQIITMLIDENQCLDLHLYQQTVQKIGLSTFILQILSIVMQKRNKYKNQYEMSKNIETITKEFDKQRVQLARRKKQLEKKQLMINQQKLALINVLQQKAKEIEEKTITKLMQIEQEIKKKVKQSIITLKSKQKQVVDKVVGLRQSLKRVKQLQSQQSKIQQKLKLLQRREKQRKSKQSSLQQSTKKQQQLTSKINTLQQVNNRLQQQIVKLNKKIKTNQMASKHYKEELERKMGKWEGERVELEKRRMGLEERVMELEMSGNKRQGLRQGQSEQLLLKTQQLARLASELQHSKQIIVSLTKQNQSLLLKLKQQQFPMTNNTTIKSVFNTNNILPEFQQLDISKIQQMQIMQQQRQYSQSMMISRSPISLQDSNVYLFDTYFNHLPLQQSSLTNSIIINNNNTNNTNDSMMLKEINEYLIRVGGRKEMECGYLGKLQRQVVADWVRAISEEIKQRKMLIEPLLELFLCILEPCTCTYHVNALMFLFSPIVITFLQQAITPSIQQKALIILSRILLSYESYHNLSHNNDSLNHDNNKFILTENYLKSLKVKSLIQKDEFILSNIKFLIEYNSL